MRIVLVSEGSRGDIQPFIALGGGLKKAGYEVTVVTGRNFESFVTGYGLEFRGLSIDYEQLMRSTDIMHQHRSNPLTTFIRRWRSIRETFIPLIERSLRETWQACLDADMMIYNPKVLAGYHIAEKKRIPSAVCLHAPLIVPTGEFANPLIPWRQCGRTINRLSYFLSRLLSCSYNDVINKWRVRELGLKKRSFWDSPLTVNGSSVPVIHTVSPSLIPRPSDWPSTAIMPGFFFLEKTASYKPPAALEKFLENGLPPVYVGFGSMVHDNPKQLTDIIVAALRVCGQRGVLVTGWGALCRHDYGDDIFFTDQVSHDWLLPKVRAVVHHGGSGSTGSGLRAGKPTVICPFFADQPYWGETVARNHAGPQPVPIRSVSIDSLARALDLALNDRQINNTARALGETIRNEDGVGQAVQFIQKLLGH